jgi:oxygen-independent coproporphyrinogen-3 oxidase
MLPAGSSSSQNPESVAAVRFSTGDDLEQYITRADEIESHCVTRAEALEEELFLGLRLNRSIDLDEIAHRNGLSLTSEQSRAIADLTADGLLLREGSRIRLSNRGRLLSNEVFARFIADKDGAVAAVKSA